MVFPLPPVLPPCSCGPGHRWVRGGRCLQPAIFLRAGTTNRSSVSSTWTTASAPGGRGAPVVIRHTPPDDTSTLGCRHEERIRDRVFTESALGVISLPSLQRSLDPELFSHLARQQLHIQPTTHQSSTYLSCSYMLSLCT
ncbi:hypothetical protein GBAR_LOCUS14057 [Geodia barretti]|uniref:Uncharacterized protein n=1 Tax=Geodia barretti TaxID=519541 RepID=A0AA35WJW0_GEOBA|nr:hypothetical protein GBAR_LOCUS14057 [Geodia barretti]